MQYFNQKLYRHRRSLQTGVSIIEVVVTLLIISVAGFGVLSMSTFATQESNSLRFEVTADYLGRSLLSRIQVNAVAANKNLYVFDSNAAGSNAMECAEGCNPAQIAALDKAEWISEAQYQLPDVQFRTWWEGNQIKLALAWTGPIERPIAADCPLTLANNQTCQIYTASVLL